MEERGVKCDRGLFLSVARQWAFQELGGKRIKSLFIWISGHKLLSGTDTSKNSDHDRQKAETRSPTVRTGSLNVFPVSSSPVFLPNKARFAGYKR
jgi:hypothetical protein